MENDPENKSPRKRPLAIAFLFGCVGLLLMDGAANMLPHNKHSVLGWMFLIAGLVFAALALLWGAGQI